MRKILHHGQLFVEEQQRRVGHLREQRLPVNNEIGLGRLVARVLREHKAPQFSPLRRGLLDEFVHALLHLLRLSRQLLSVDLVEWSVGAFASCEQLLFLQGLDEILDRFLGLVLASRENR